MEAGSAAALPSLPGQGAVAAQLGLCPGGGGGGGGGEEGGGSPLAPAGGGGGGGCRGGQQPGVTAPLTSLSVLLVDQAATLGTGPVSSPPSPVRHR